MRSVFPRAFFPATILLHPTASFRIVDAIGSGSVPANGEPRWNFWEPMTTMKNDEGIRAVREIRKLISAECGNDPVRLVDRYLARLKQYANHARNHESV